MANNIAQPLEKQFLLINGLTLITSNSTQNNTSPTLQNAGRYAYTLSGINPADLCSAAVRWWASCANTPVF